MTDKLYYLTHFMSLISFQTPWKHQKTRSFLLFSGGIKSDQWHEMGSYGSFKEFLNSKCPSCPSKRLWKSQTRQADQIHLDIWQQNGSKTKKKKLILPHFGPNAIRLQGRRNTIVTDFIELSSFVSFYFFRDCFERRQ